MKEKLLILHGALGSQAMFAELKEKLSTQFYVFDFNFAGHGGLPIQEPFTIDRFVRNTRDFLGQSGLDAVHIFGYSMGGYVALKLAGDFPGKANKIITLGTKFRWNPESATKEVCMMNPDVIEQKIAAFAATFRERHQPEDCKINHAPHRGDDDSIRGWRS
jgi:pimeloyl-ACP methyl ester carboxylesterase